MRAEREAAYVEFVHARQAHLRRIAYAICGDWHRADDLLQTALVKLYVAWPRLHLARAARRPTSARIMVRANIDEHRRPWRRERPGLAGATTPPAASGSGSRSGRRCSRRSSGCPTMQRKVVLLRHWLGLSVAETAAELRIGTGTVKSHSSRGLHALEAALAEPPLPDRHR